MTVSTAVSVTELLCHAQAYDEVNNKRLSGGDDFQVKLVGPGGRETQAELQDQEDGTYLVFYCVTAAGTHDLHVTIGQPALASGNSMRMLQCCCTQ